MLASIPSLATCWPPGLLQGGQSPKTPSPLCEVGSIGYSENNWVKMYFKSPYVKIRTVRGLPGRTTMRMTWIETYLRHWHWDSCTDSDHECGQKKGWQSQAAPGPVQLKPWLHWIWHCLSFKVLLYRILKVLSYLSLRIRDFCIIQWKPS